MSNEDKVEEVALAMYRADKADDTALLSQAKNPDRWRRTARAAIDAISMRPEKQTLLDVGKPMVKWLCENHHPHVTVLVTPTRIELVEALVGLVVNEYVKD